MINLNLKNQDFINATKVVLVTVLTLTLVHKFTSPLGMYFALYISACVVMMQAGEAKSAQFVSMLIAGAAFLFFLAFGLIVRPHPILSNTALIVFAFIAFYLPNVGWNYKLPPVLGIIFYVLVISMSQAAPFASSLTAGSIAVIVAIAVYFFFWPYDVKHELTLTAQTTLYVYRNLLQSYTKMIRRPKSNEHILEDAQNILSDITKLLAGYEKLNEGASLKKEEVDYFDALYLDLYSLLQINTMLVERFPVLNTEARLIAQQILRNLIGQLQMLEYRFDAMVPHSLIAKNIIGKSLKLGKAITETLSLHKQKVHKPRISDEEFSRLLEKLIADHSDVNKRFAFGLLRIQELLDQIHSLQENVPFNVNQAIFL